MAIEEAGGEQAAHDGDQADGAGIVVVEEAPAPPVEVPAGGVRAGVVAAEGNDGEVPGPAGAGSSTGRHRAGSNSDSDDSSSDSGGSDSDDSSSDDSDLDGGEGSGSGPGSAMDEKVKQALRAAAEQAEAQRCKDRENTAKDIAKVIGEGDDASFATRWNTFCQGVLSPLTSTSEALLPLLWCHP